MPKPVSPAAITAFDDRDFAEAALGYFYPVHYRFGMEMENAMGQGRIGRKHAALLWLIHSEAGKDGWIARKLVEQRLGEWFEMSNPNVTKIIRDLIGTPHGFVELADSPGSGREKIMSLTASGRTFIAGMIEQARGLLAVRVGHLPVGELRDGLRFLLKAFGGRVPAI